MESSSNKYCYIIGIVLIILFVGFLAYRENTVTRNRVDFNSATGKQAPDFTLEDINGKSVKLSDYKGKNVILFFNEGAMCYPSCWNQMAMLATDKRFNTDNAVAFSIVIDTKEEWKDIMDRMPQFSKAKILFDTTKIVSENYGVLTLPSSMHMGSMPGHSYVVIDKEGIIRYTLDDPNMGIRNDQLAAQLENF